MTRNVNSPAGVHIQPRDSGVTEQVRPGSVLLSELVSHLRQNRTQLREEWARRITEAQLLTAMTKDEIFARCLDPAIPRG